MAVTVSSVLILNSKQVKLTLSELKQGQVYQLGVSNLKDIDGVTVTAGPKSFTGIGVAPRVSAAAYNDTTHIDIDFNEAMANNAALTTASNYVVSGASSPNTSGVVRNSATQVTIALDASMVTGDYTVTVSNVTDLAGNTIDPAHNSSSFSAVVGHWGGHPTLSDDLIAHYKLEGDAVDSSPHGYNGTFPDGSPSTVAGKINNALAFTSPQKMNIAANALFNGLNAFTMSIWVKIPTVASLSWHTLCGRHGQCVLAVVGDGEHQGKVWMGTFHIPGSPILCQTLTLVTLSDNVWYHVVGQFNGVDWTYIYINGVQRASGNFGAALTLVDSTHPIRIAMMQNNMEIDGNEDIRAPLEGVADEVSFWNRCITSDEITYLYNSGSGVPY